MKRKQLLLLLALLMTAATGAWAQSTPTEVSTFADLLTALSAGNDVKLTANIQFTSSIGISGTKKITIDGNGKTMSGPSTCAFTISSGNTLAIKNATIDNFDRSEGGGAILNRGTLVLDGCTVSNNHTDGSNKGGGAIENQGTLYASNTTFSGNYSSEIGGAINNYRGSLYLSACTFTNNYTTSSSADYGGAIGNNSNNTLVLVNCTFSGNKYGGSTGRANDLGFYSSPGSFTIAGCTGIVIAGGTLTTYQYGTATLDYSDLSAISFTYDKSHTPIALPAVPKHLITATHDNQTRSLEQPLPYATTVGALYESVTGQSFSDLISTFSAMQYPLNGISSDNTSVVSIGELNGASTPVTVNADGKATVAVIFGGYAQGIFVSVTPPLYVTMKDGVKDAGKWTAKVGDGGAQALPIGGLKGDGSETVTLQYNGRLKVKSVKATTEAQPAANVVDLSTLTADYEAQNGDVMTGVTTSYKVTIAAGATVTLDGVNISSGSYCIKCLGEATIILKDGSTNTLTSTYTDYPALSIGDTNTTLTIQGSTGVLDVTSGSNYAGIGGGYRNTNHTCGNIRIEGGFITARGGAEAAGIGTDYGPAYCGDITITGGTINATGGQDATGIGAGRGAPGNPSNCGAITITNGVTKVTATKGVCTDLIDCIGAGYGNSSCGTVTIGGTVYWENNAYANGGDTYLTTSPLIYPQSN